MSPNKTEDREEKVNALIRAYSNASFVEEFEGINIYQIPPEEHVAVKQTKEKDKLDRYHFGVTPDTMDKYHAKHLPLVCLVGDEGAIKIPLDVLDEYLKIAYITHRRSYSLYQVYIERHEQGSPFVLWKNESEKVWPLDDFTPFRH